MTFEEKMKSAAQIIYYATCEQSPYFSSRTVPEMYKPLVKAFVKHKTEVIDSTSFCSIPYRDNELVALIQVKTNDNVNRRVRYYNYSWMADDGKKLHVLLIPDPYRYNKVPHLSYNGSESLTMLMKELVDPDHYHCSELNTKNGMEEFFDNICLFCITIIDRYVMESIGKTYNVADGTRIMDIYYSSEPGKLPEAMIYEFASDLHNGVIYMQDLVEFKNAYENYYHDLITRLRDEVTKKQ